MCVIYENSPSENHRETLQLTMPDDDRIVPSFYYKSSEFSGNPISMKYMLRIEVKVRGFFKDFNLNIAIIVHAKKRYIAPSNEDEAPPPSYDVAIATH